jgi:hypothetical protein
MTAADVLQGLVGAAGVFIIGAVIAWLLYDMLRRGP